MSKKAYSLIAVILLFGFILSGCNRSATTPQPAITATSQTDFGFPVVTPGEGQPANPAGGATQTSGEKEPVGMTPQAGGGVIATQTEGEQSGGGVPTQEAEQANQGGQPAEAATSEPSSSSNTEVQLPTVSVPNSYTLQRGEWPYCIARRFNVSAGALLSANGLGVNSKPSVGTTLTIPQGTSWNSGSIAWHAHPSTYTVQSGNSVNSIACYYGNVDPSQIIALNNLQAPYSLTTGQSLQIP